MKKIFNAILFLSLVLLPYSVSAEAGIWVQMPITEYNFNLIEIPETATGVLYDKYPTVEAINQFSTNGLKVNGGQIGNPASPVYMSGFNVVKGETFEEGEAKIEKLLLYNGANSTLTSFPQMSGVVGNGFVNIEFVTPAMEVGKYRYSITMKSGAALTGLSTSIIRNGQVAVASKAITIETTFTTFTAEYEETLGGKFNTILRLGYLGPTNMNDKYLAISEIKVERWDVDTSIERNSNTEGVSIVSADREIAIYGADQQRANIYSLSGILVHSQTCTSSVEKISLDRGAYIVKVGKQAAKVIL